MENNVVKFVMAKIRKDQIERVGDRFSKEGDLGLSALSHNEYLYTRSSAFINFSLNPDASGVYWMEIFNHYTNYEAVLKLARKIAKDEGLEIIDPLSPDWVLAQYLSSPHFFNTTRRVFLLRDFVIAKVGVPLHGACTSEEDSAYRKDNLVIVRDFYGPAILSRKKVSLTLCQGPFSGEIYNGLNGSNCVAEDATANALAKDKNQIWFEASLVDQ